MSTNPLYIICGIYYNNVYIYTYVQCMYMCEYVYTYMIYTHTYIVVSMFVVCHFYIMFTASTNCPVTDFRHKDFFVVSRLVTGNHPACRIIGLCDDLVNFQISVA